MASASTTTLPDTTKQGLKEYTEDNCESESQAVNELIDVGLRQTGYLPHQNGDFAASMTSYLFIAGMSLMVAFFITRSRSMMYVTLLVFSVAVFAGLYAEEVRNHRLPRSKGEFKRLIRRVV